MYKEAHACRERYKKSQEMSTAVKEDIISVVNPATCEKIFEIKSSTDSEIKEKVNEAKSTFPLWSRTPIEKRVSYLSRIYELILQDRENIARTITKNNGKPLCESYLTEVASTLQVIGYFIKDGSELLSEKEIKLGPLYLTKKSSITYEPYGLIAIIEPWNYPFYLPLAAITKALITGNTFIFKPSSTVSLVGKLIEDLLNKAELPGGVASVIYGDSAKATLLIGQDVDKVVFTGSASVGKQIAETCAKRLVPLTLELGGKDPAIVLKDANIDYTAGGIVWGAISNCGQACASVERVYADSDIYSDLTQEIVSIVRELKIGDGLDEETDVGPLINQEQLTKIEDHVSDAKDKGAKVLTGGKRKEGTGYFYEPTVLENVNHSMKVMKEETFGPIIPVMKFKNIDEAIQLSNDTRYGLASSIWTSETQNAKKIASELNCGTVWINDSLFLQAHPACPWQGYRDSGYGGSSIFDFVKTKHTSIDYGYIPKLRPKSFWWYPYKGKARSYHDLIEVIFRKTIKEKAKASFQTLLDFLR